MCEIDDALLQWNRRGLFPGPGESEEDFFRRAEAQGLCKSSVPVKAHSLLEERFDSSPDWIETFTHSRGLFPWEGAATWIEEKEDGIRICRIQIKHSFLTRLYPPDEVLAHEMVHAMRLMFDEGRFEEILAYRTSKNRFRRFFGPLFSNAKESKVFILSIGLSWLVYGAEAVFDFPVFGSSILFFPLLLLAGGILRLKKEQSIFSSALCHLAKSIKADANPLSVALRLTDDEILLFSRSTPQEIQAFAKEQRGKNLRWRQLCLSYFD